MKPVDHSRLETTEVTGLRDEATRLQTEVDRHIDVEKGLTGELASLNQKTFASERLFRLLVGSVKDYAIFMLNPQGAISTWNTGAKLLKGYEAEEIIGCHFSKFYLPEDIATGKCEGELAEATRVGRFEDEGWRVRKDGSKFWANVVLTAVRDGDGALVGFAKVTRDLTERKRAEDQRLVEAQRFDLLVNSVKDYAIFILGPEGRVQTWSAGAEKIKGYTGPEIIGAHFSTFYPKEDVQTGKCERELEIATREGRFEEEGWRVRKDGSRFWANVVISAIWGEGRHLVGFSKVTRDLTERRRTEEEVAARMAAEEANKVKDEFMAMLGHELRNPLAPIVSALQLLKLRGDANSVREHQIIERQVAQMTRLVDDLLDVSRMSRGKVALKKQALALRDCLADAAEMALPLFERKGQKLDVQVPTAALPLEGDKARLTQVFANLLNNAAKYTPEGGRITLSVEEHARELSVQVRDDGNGIDPALLPRVFELFVQGYRDADRAEGGLGIGLTLVRSLVELHGGRVEAHSKGVGQGSTFTVHLPYERAEVSVPASVPARAPVKPAAVPAAGKRRVLVVDDNQDARELLGELLTALGHQVQVAGDGPQALQVLQSFPAEVAVLDIGLPGMSGHELAARIKELEGGGAIQLVAVTGYGRPASPQQGEKSAFDVHLVKPIDVRRLTECFAGLATK